MFWEFNLNCQNVLYLKTWVVVDYILHVMKHPEVETREINLTNRRLPTPFYQAS